MQLLKFYHGITFAFYWHCILDKDASFECHCYTHLDPRMLWAQMFLEIRVVTRRTCTWRSRASSLASQYLMACRIGPFGSLGFIYVWHLCSFVLIRQIISYYNVYIYASILTFSIPRTSFVRNMHHGAQSSAQGACCLDIGFRHMFSAPDCDAFRVIHVSCGWWKGMGSACAVTLGRGRL